MATSSKHDHKNVGCHRIGPPPQSGDRVLATIRTPAEIDKHRKKPQPDGAGAKLVILFVRIGQILTAYSGPNLSAGVNEKPQLVRLGLSVSERRELFCSDRLL